MATTDHATRLADQLVQRILNDTAANGPWDSDDHLLNGTQETLFELADHDTLTAAEYALANAVMDRALTTLRATPGLVAE